VPLWACELTSKHIIVAGVNKSRRQVTAKLASDLPSGTVAGSLTDTNIRNLEAVRSNLKDLLSHAGFKGSEIVVIVPDDAARIAFLTAERLSKDPEVVQTFIRWKLKKTVPFEVDQAQVAFRVLRPQHGSTSVDMLVAISPRSVVEEYESLFDSLGIHPGLVLPSTLAALNLFDVPPEDTLFLKIAPDCMTTTVFRNRRMQFYRRVTVMSLYDAVYPTVMYYQDKLGGKALEQLTVCGYDSDIPSSNELQGKLGLRAQRLEPKSVDDMFKPVLGAVHLSHPEGVV
jgi:type IV pilus assembly protein PilM